MEKKINLAKLLKDCPKGMELNCMMYEDVYFDYVDELNIIHCYIQNEGFKTSITFNQHGTPNSDIKSKCVIFPKGKTTWEEFQRPFKDGDILTTDLGSIFVLKEPSEKECYYSCYIALNDVSCIVKNYTHFCIKKGCRLATEEEKEKLFQAIKANGYEWNPETKALKKLPKFKDGDILTIDDTVYIYNGIEELSPFPSHYVYVIADKSGLFAINTSTKKYGTRFATEEEKEMLFDAIKANGYKWNPETKTLEKLINKNKFVVGTTITNGKIISKIVSRDIDSYQLENGNYVFFNEVHNWELVPNKFDINTLKPFKSKVLVRNFTDERWKPAIFGCTPIDCSIYTVVGGIDFYKCIPYEGNEHLFGSTNDCDDFYKTWENETK